MGLERQTMFKEIKDRLCYLEIIAKRSNSLNLNDINIQAEYFYRDFLNLLYGYDLKNNNTITSNAKGIDLFDKINRIAFQVTSTSALKKTKSTVQSFIEDKLYLEYDRLIILNIVKKARHDDEFIGEENTYQLNTIDDIWDNGVILKKIQDLNTNDLKKIHDFLAEEIKFPNTPAKENINHVSVFPSHIIDERIERSLHEIKSIRFFRHFSKDEKSDELANRILQGDLSLGTDSMKAKTLALLARYISVENEEKAKSWLKESRKLKLTSEAEIAESFINSKDPALFEKIMLNLAQKSTLESNSALFIIRKNINGEEKVLEWFKATGLTIEHLDDDGKINYIQSLLKTKQWDKALEMSYARKWCMEE